MVWYSREDRGEQQLGIVEDIACDPDPREQAHRFDIVAMLCQDSADDRFGRGEVAIGEQRCRGDDLRAQPGECGDVGLGGDGVGDVAAHAVQAGQHPPRLRQCRVAVDRVEQSRDGGGRVPARDVGEAAFLPHQAELGMGAGEPVERRQRRLDPAAQPFADRLDQQQVAVVRYVAQPRRGSGDDGVVLPCRLCPPQAEQFILDGRSASHVVPGPAGNGARRTRLVAPRRQKS